MTTAQILILIIPSIILLILLVYGSNKNSDWYFIRAFIGALCIVALVLLGLISSLEMNRLQGKYKGPQYEPVQEQLYHLKQ